LRGKDKNQESLGGLFRSIGALRGEFGRVQVSFGSPIELAGYLDAVAPEWREAASDEQFRPGWFADAVAQLGERIMVGINDTAVVNTTGLVALVMLAMPKQAAVEAELLAQMRLYLRLLGEVPYSTRISLSELTPQEMVTQAERMGWLERQRHPLGDVLSMTERQAVLASYYRNTLLHLMALPALIACAVVNRPDQSRAELKVTMKSAFPLMRAELFLGVEEVSLDGAVDRQLSAMAMLGLLRLQPLGDRVMAPDQGAGQAAQLELLAQIATPFVERYYLGAALLLAAGPGQWRREELINRSRQAAEHLALLYSLNSPDLFAKDLFKTFAATLCNLDVIGIDDEGRLVFDESLQRLAHGLNRMLPPRESRTVWQFARANTSPDSVTRLDPE
jgi:glycerol-3-phosphate O-acyltransferase